jgi:hypothetical protein
MQAFWLMAVEALSAKMAAAMAGNTAIVFMFVLAMPFAAPHLSCAQNKSPMP